MGTMVGRRMRTSRLKMPEMRQTKHIQINTNETMARATVQQTTILRPHNNCLRKIFTSSLKSILTKIFNKDWEEQQQQWEKIKISHIIWQSISDVSAIPAAACWRDNVTTQTSVAVDNRVGRMGGFVWKRPSCLFAFFSIEAFWRFVVAVRVNI